MLCQICLWYNLGVKNITFALLIFVAVYLYAMPASAETFEIRKDAPVVTMSVNPSLFPTEKLLQPTFRLQYKTDISPTAIPFTKQMKLLPTEFRPKITGNIQGGKPGSQKLTKPKQTAKKLSLWQYMMELLSIRKPKTSLSPSPKIEK